MRKIREVLRLHEAEHLSSRAVGIAVGLPRTTVRNYIDRAREVGLHWPLPDDLDDRDREERLFGRAAPPPAILSRPEPDWAAIHAEMRRPHVTFMLVGVKNPDSRLFGLQKAPMLFLFGLIIRASSRLLVGPRADNGSRDLERYEVEALLRGLPQTGRLALRDRTLLVFLYNTGARVQEAADLRVDHLDLGEHPRVRLHGKGDKWRTYPLWQRTDELLRSLLRSAGEPLSADAPVFSARGEPLTRFGIYKIVRRHAGTLDQPHPDRRVSPHIFRHTAAVHLLETGVEANVIRGWLGHADLSATNRYAEINTRTQEAALRALEPPISSAEPRSGPVWRSDEALLKWLASL